MVGVSVPGPQGSLWAVPGPHLASCFLVLWGTQHPHSALCCIFVTCSDKLHVGCQGRHKGIKPGGFAQFLAAVSAMAAGHQ